MPHSTRLAHDGLPQQPEAAIQQALLLNRVLPQAAQEGVQILSLAVLLSSLFVFNQMGPIDEAALDRLSLVTEITQRIRIRASSTEPGGWSGSSSTLCVAVCVERHGQPGRQEHNGA
jgi:hypothetical protein